MKSSWGSNWGFWESDCLVFHLSKASTAEVAAASMDGGIAAIDGGLGLGF
ncbi:hypothetical protein Hanom_Chr06g00562671 [Helianthus anomalus]